MAKKINVYGALKEALADAIAYEHGAGMDLRVTETPPVLKPIRPEEIKVIRDSLHASQAVFARYIGVSTKAIQSWEQGTRRPQNTALRLLWIAKENPRVLVSGAHVASAQPNSAY